MEGNPNEKKHIEIAANEKTLFTEKPLLPVCEYHDQIMEQIKLQSTVIVIGQTGSGKTTEIPGFLMDEFPDKRIAVTQPRRIATRSVSEYVAARRDISIGQEIGYRMRFDNHSNDGTRANFVTDGILLQEMRMDPLLMSYDIVMVDEAHERSLNIDFLLGLLKKAQRDRREKGEAELKIIISSATLEKERFSKYFDEAETVEVPGRLYPVETKFVTGEMNSHGIEDYPKRAASVVGQIVNSDEPGDILVFMPRMQEIQATVEQINILNLQDIEIYILHSMIKPEDQQKVFTPSNKRKIIIATNIAETSITIDGVKFVVDSGLINEKDFDLENGMEIISVKPHAKSGCEQRKGRAGRTAPGVCYRLYSQADFERRQDFQKPEISRSNLDHVVLTMKRMGINDIINFDFIESPDRQALVHAIRTLQDLDALDEKENITELGIKMSELPLTPERAKMLISSEEYGCVGHVCTILSMIGDKSVFWRPNDKEEAVLADKCHNAFMLPESDFLTLLNVWNKWERSGFNVNWAKQNYLNVRQLFEAGEIRSQLLRRLAQIGISAENMTYDLDLIRKAVAAGLINDFMESNGGHSYRRFTDSEQSDFEEIFIFPGSALFYQSPQYIAADRRSIKKTRKTYARLCQQIEPEWIPELAPHLFLSDVENQKAYYERYTDQVMESQTYTFRANEYKKLRISRPVLDKEKANRIFIEAIVQGQIHNFVFDENLQKVEDLKRLNIRSGGKVEIPDLADWYAKRLNGISSLNEFLELDLDIITFDIDTYCSAEFRQRIDDMYPTSFEIRNYHINIDYFFETNKGGKDPKNYEARIIIPYDILPISDNDIPKIGENGRPRVTFQISNYGYTRPEVFSTLEQAIDSEGDRLEASRNLQEQLSNARRPVYYNERPVSPKGFEVNAFDNVVAKFTNDFKTEGQEKAEISKPVKEEKKPTDIIITNELRNIFDQQISEMEFLLDILRDVLSNNKNKEAERLKSKIKDLKRRIFEDKKVIEESTVVNDVRSRIGTLSGDTQRLIKDFERTSILTAGWNERYLNIMNKFKIQAETDGLIISGDNILLIRKKAAELASEYHSDIVLDQEVEKAIIELI